MKTLKMTWVVLALISSFNVFAGSVGQNNGKVECTESVQSGRFEGGNVEVEDYTSDASENETNASER